ncbi:MAG: ABC transporter permease [Endomicrobia bacterium]|nr:ABC transporter permease [Endomicrobiia bacterium]MCL2507417.1 ABC transporter permease [Endomicrobiia bacterium]
MTNENIEKIAKARRLARKTAKFSFGSFYSFLDGLGLAAQRTGETFFWILKGQIPIKSTISQMVEMGWRTFPIIFLTSFFTGMVLALQVGTSTANLFNEPVYVGTIVGFSLVLELGPVLTAVVVAGRIGAAITAEIGTMKVTEQLDALYTLGTNPIKYLAVPRFVACILMLPLLTAMANIIGIYGGLIITTNTWDVSSAIYWSDVLDFMEVGTFLHGFIKSFFFAGIIVSVACHKGFSTAGGAEGVGKATTSSVMTSLVLVMVSDYFLSALLMALGID